MQLNIACKNILVQLKDAIDQMNAEDFVKPSLSLSYASVGAHVRHTLEFFICLEAGFEDGVVNYDKRAHDKQIETDKTVALLTIARISAFIDEQKKDKKLFLEVGYEPHEENFVTIETNYLRELTYNIEHAVHHMAIMKIGIREVAPNIKLSADFGVAVSTVRYKETNQLASR
jgi:hypothetical protein